VAALHGHLGEARRPGHPLDLRGVPASPEGVQGDQAAADLDEVDRDEPAHELDRGRQQPDRQISTSRPAGAG
jgi:hypothetical protein